jgi:hypothetical protein
MYLCLHARLAITTKKHFSTHYFFPPFLPSSHAHPPHIISSQTTMAMAIAMAATVQPIKPTYTSRHH